MSGPRIYWDAHNYLSMGLCIGPAPDEDVYGAADVSEEQEKLYRTELLNKDVDTGYCIDWSEDPEEFAKSLEEAAAWLRKLAVANLTPGKFHIRTDID